jgi:hypothetical protein
MDVSEIVETLFIGLIGTFFLGAFAGFIYAVIKNPWIVLVTLGFFLVLYSVGWVMKNYDRFMIEFATANKPPIPTKAYGVPILDGLDKFEKKYHLTTVQFMNFVYHEWIPAGMNNLDYIEWLAMASQLASITLEKKGEK